MQNDFQYQDEPLEIEPVEPVEPVENERLEEWNNQDSEHFSSENKARTMTVTLENPKILPGKVKNKIFLNSF